MIRKDFRNDLLKGLLFLFCIKRTSSIVEFLRLLLLLLFSFFFNCFLAAHGQL